MNRKPPPCLRQLARTVRIVIVSAVLFDIPAASFGQQAETPEVFGKVYHCKPGPWGDLEYYYIYLEAPDRVLQEMRFPDRTPKWKFPNGSDAGARELFGKAGLPIAFQDYLLDPRHRVIEDKVLTVFPPLPDLLAMTPEQRTAIYSALGKNGLNKLCAEPICITDSDPDSWLAQSQLRPPLREAVKKLIYQRGDMMCFSDVPAILGMAQSEREIRDVVKTMWRTRSLVLQLSVKARSDFAAALRYWSGNDRNEEVESIILPMANSAGPKRMDCRHFLPSIPRRHLYTYPTIELAMSERLPDCNWTSLNFFNATPFDYHSGVERLILRLNEAYTPVDSPYRFGDVLVMMAPGEVYKHSCVYLADDIVYTKNGASCLAPWLLMKIGDVKQIYSDQQPITVHGFRLDAPTGEEGT